MLNIQNLIDDAQCFETVRALRGPDGLHCVHCGSVEVTRQGRDPTPPERQTYRCKACDRGFDELTGTVLAGHHRPLRSWVLCLYFMGLNLSNRPIGQELELNKDDVQRMTYPLREGIACAQPEPVLSGEVEADAVSVVAGHKGPPAAVKKVAPATAPASERCARRRHLGEGEAADFRADSARGCAGDSPAGACPADDHRAIDSRSCGGGGALVYR